MEPKKPRKSPASERPLLKAWLASGGTKASYDATLPQAISPYEEEKLHAAGVILKTSRTFFEKARGLVGEDKFEDFCADVADREQVRDMRGNEYGGAKPRNPTGMIIGLLLHRIAGLTPRFHASREEVLAVAPKTPHPATREKEKQPIQLSLIETPIYTKEQDERLRRRIERAMTQTKLIQEKTAKERGEITYSSVSLVQASLPHLDPGNATVWQRTNGRKMLVVQTGIDSITGKPLGLPYGSFPRLALYHIATQVKLTGNPRISLGRSIYAFLKALGVSDNKKNYIAVSEQCKRLFASRMSLVETKRRTNLDGYIEGINTKYFPPLAKETEWWFSSGLGTGPQLDFESYIILHEEFFQNMMQNSFPIDQGVIRILRRSSLGLDVYGWLCYRNFLMNTHGASELHIPTDKLFEQFGSTYRRERDFRARLGDIIRVIAPHWRGGLNYELDETGLLLKPSPLQIEK
ncbi:hypothetical protein OPIT5_00460 (plasmid) [Opitutaceae bacterium TAV5]|nr:hypothetical protein OPIT5_00460 [Opitutaceae bacterium TAV5]